MIEKNCPIEKTMEYIGSKWTLIIIRDLFFGRKRFREFLSANPALSTKVLSSKLKELETNKLIVKEITSKSPVIIEYKLTQKGGALNKVLWEVAMYGVTNLKKEISNTSCSPEAIKYLRNKLEI